MKAVKTRKSITDADREIGRRVKLRRNMIGVTQESLGNALGVTFQQVQKYEKGTNRIGSGRLQEIARILKCPMSYFYDEVQNADKVPQASEFFKVHGAVQIAQAFAMIGDAKTRLALLELARLMAKQK